MDEIAGLCWATGSYNGYHFEILGRREIGDDDSEEKRCKPKV
jgi:hypothetical protein